MGLQSTLPPLWHSSDGDLTLSLSCLQSRGGPTLWYKSCPSQKARQGVFWAVCLMPKLPSKPPQWCSSSHVYQHNTAVLGPRGFLGSKWPPLSLNLYLYWTWLAWLFWETSEWDAPEVQPERISEKHSFHCSEQNLCTQIMCWSWFYPIGRMNAVWLTPHPMGIWGIVFSGG